MKLRQIMPHITPRLLLQLIAVMIFSLGLILPEAGRAASMQIIRDVEIEEALQSWAAPLIKAADLEQEHVKIILVQSDQVNAFVAGGANIFIYTGLIQKTENPGELIGVLAHELGHIAGGHLIQNIGALKRASYESILGTVLGIGAAILSGDGRLASAISLGTQGVATSNYLSHSRTNESSADQAAVRYLQESKQSANGLISFFKKLQNQELLPAHKQDEYVRTHPLTSNRIEMVRRSTGHSPYADKPWSKGWVEQHKRMKAKLLGFIQPNYVAWTYHDHDQSFAARYARAIAAFKNNDIDQSLALIAQLQKQEPDNPYLFELKAQVLMEYGRVEEALAPLQRTLEIGPNVALFNISMAHGLIEHAHRAGAAQAQVDLQKAVEYLHKASHEEANSSYLKRLLATAYGRLGRDLEAKLALSQEALLQGKAARARALAQQVIDKAPKESALSIHAQDVLKHLEQRPKKK